MAARFISTRVLVAAVRISLRLGFGRGPAYALKRGCAARYGPRRRGAVWARGDADPLETDPDLRSDVDLIAIVDPALDAARVSWELAPQLEAIVDALGDSPVYCSLRIYDTAHLRERRRIRSFFFQEVDQDKLVLHGGALEGPAQDARKAA